MAKMYTLDDKLLTGCNEIRIGDKVYPVDNRTSTVKALAKLKTDDSDEILRLGLGPDASKEVLARDLPFDAYIELVKLVTAAMTGEDPEAVEARFQQGKQTAD